MATTTRRSRTTISSGPWVGVRTTLDPFDGGPNQLVDAQNYYIPDPQGGSGLYARRGFGILNIQSPYMGRGQGVFCHVVAGVQYNFIAAGGKILRGNNGLTEFTDVTPPTISVSRTNTHIYFTTFGEKLIISDEVNDPWIASDLTNTPITGTVIDYNGTGVPNSGDPWAATGQPVVYSGSLFFILKSVANVLQPPTFVWSAPGNPAQGYFQDDGALNAFDYTWTVEQTNAHPLYGLAATNTALYYFRDYFIGAVAGTPGPDFQGSATNDVVSVNIGCLQSATIHQYGQTIFFCDALGRPYALQAGSPPIPLWLSLRQIVNTSTSQYPGATAQVAIATIHPILNLYIVAPWSPIAGSPDAPIEAYCFDTKTLAYVGRWSIQSGASMEALGILNDTVGYASLIVLGTEPPIEAEQQEIITQHGDYLNTQSGFRLVAGPAVVVDWLLTTESGLFLTTESGIDLGVVNEVVGRTGVIWGMDATIGDGDPITSEDGLYIISSEDGYGIMSENQLISWMDDGIAPTRTLTTQRLGYSADHILNTDQVTIITQDNTPYSVTMTTTNTASTVEGTSNPGASQDGTYRLVCGSDVSGRGIQVTVSPTTADVQSIVQSISVVAIPSLAGPEEF